MKDLDLNKFDVNEIKILIIGNQNLKLNIIENMETYGGSFVKSLSKCILMADPNSLSILIDSFTNYFIEYQPKNWKK